MVYRHKTVVRKVFIRVLVIQIQKTVVGCSVHTLFVLSDVLSPNTVNSRGPGLAHWGEDLLCARSNDCHVLLR